MKSMLKRLSISAAIFAAGIGLRVMTAGVAHAAPGLSFSNPTSGTPTGTSTTGSTGTMQCGLGQLMTGLSVKHRTGNLVGLAAECSSIDALSRLPTVSGYTSTVQTTAGSTASAVNLSCGSGKILSGWNVYEQSSTFLGGVQLLCSSYAIFAASVRVEAPANSGAVTGGSSGTYRRAQCDSGQAVSGFKYIYGTTTAFVQLTPECATPRSQLLDVNVRISPLSSYNGFSMTFENLTDPADPKFVLPINRAAPQYVLTAANYRITPTIPSDYEVLENTCAPSFSLPVGTPTVCNLGIQKKNQLSVSQVQPQFFALSQRADYKIRVKNEGVRAVNAANVKVDVIGNVTYHNTAAATNAANGWSCTGSPGTIDCNYSGSISVGGESPELLVPYASLNNFSAGQTVSNRVSVGSTGGVAIDPSSCTPDGSTCLAGSVIPIHQTSGLSIAFGTAPSYHINSESRQQVFVQNGGAIATNNIKFNLSLPNGLSLVSSIGSGFTCTGTSTLACTYAPLLNAGSSVAFNLVLKPTAMIVGGKINAAINVHNGTPPAAAETCAYPGECKSIPLGTVGPGVNLSIELTVPPTPPFVVGVSKDVTVKLTNSLNGTKINPDVRIVLPPGMKFANGMPQSGSIICTVESSGDYRCYLPGAMTGRTATATLKLIADSSLGGASPEIWASTTATGFQSAQAPNACALPLCSSRSTGSILTGAKLNYTVSGPTPELQVGRQSRFDVSVTNSGTGAAVPKFTFVLPNSLQRDRIEPARDWSCTSGRYFTCTKLASVAANGGDATASIYVTPDAVDAGVPVTVSAGWDIDGGSVVAEAGNCDATPDNCWSQTVTVPKPVALSAAFDSAVPEFAVGRPVSVVLNLANSGDFASNTTTVFVALPSGVVLETNARSSEVDCKGTPQNCTVDVTVPGGGATSVSLNLMTQLSASGSTPDIFASVHPSGTDIAAPARGCTPGAPPSTCAKVSTGLIRNGVSLNGVLSAPSTPMTAGVESIYPFEIKNDGTGPAVGLKFNVFVPDSADLVGVGPANLWSCTPVSEGRTECTRSSSLYGGAAPSSAQIKVRPRLDSSVDSLAVSVSFAPDGAAAPMLAGATCTVPDRCKTATAGVVKPAALSLSFDALPAEGFTVGKPEQVRLKVFNNGGVDSTAKIRMSLPDGVTIKALSPGNLSCSDGVRHCTLDISAPRGGAPTTITLNLSVDETAAGKPIALYAAVDERGEQTPASFDICAVIGPQCAVMSAADVSSGIHLSWTIHPADEVVAGKPYPFMLAATSDGYAAGRPVFNFSIDPAKASVDSLDSSSEWNCSNMATGSFTCTYYKDLSPGDPDASAIIQLVAKETSTGSLTVAASWNATGSLSPPVAGCGTSPDECTTISVRVYNPPKLAINFGAAPSAFVVGKGVAIPVNVSNTGDLEATRVKIAIAMQDGLRIDSSVAHDMACSADLRECTKTLTVPAYKTDPTQFMVHVKPDVSAAGKDLNIYAALDASDANNPASPTQGCQGVPTCASLPTGEIHSGVTLSIDLEGPTPDLGVGTTSTYTVKIKNNGSAVASSQTFKVKLSGSVHLDTPEPSWSCVGSASAWTCTGSAPLAAGGVTSAPLKVTPNAGTGGQAVVVSVAVDPSGGGNPVEPGGCSTPGICKSVGPYTVDAKVNLSVEFVSLTTESFAVGQNTPVTLNLRNSGTVLSKDSPIRLALPTGLALNPNMLPPNAECTAQSCTFTVDVLPNNVLTPVTLNLLPKPGGEGPERDIYASVTQTGASLPDDTPGCSDSKLCARLTIGPVSNGVDLAIGINASSPSPLLSVGNVSSYEVSVRNKGTADAASPSFRFNLPSSLSFNGVNGSDWSCSDAGSGIHNCVKQSPLIAKGTQATASLDVTPNAGTGGQNVVLFAAVDKAGAAFTDDPRTCASSALDCKQSSPATIDANVKLSMAFGTLEPMAVGRLSNVTLTVTNTGSATTADTPINIGLPSSLRLVLPADAECGGVPLVCTVKKNLPNGATPIALTVTADEGAAGKTDSIRASANGTGGSPAPAPANCSEPDACHSVSTGEVNSGIALKIGIKEPASIGLGVPSKYEVTVSNTGTADAPVQNFKFSLPASLSYVSVEAGSGWTCDPDKTQTWSCTRSTPMTAGIGTSTAMLNVVPEPTAAGENVVMHAAVDPAGKPMASDPYPCIGALLCVSSNPLTVASNVALRVELDQAATPFSVGTASAVNMTLTNSGSFNKNKVPVRLTVPAGVTLEAASGLACGQREGNSYDCTFDSPAEPGKPLAAILSLMPDSTLAGKPATIYALIHSEGSAPPAGVGVCSPNGAICSIKSIGPVGNGVQLSATLSAPDAPLGMNATSNYTLTLANSGKGDARARFKLWLPAALDLKSGTLAPDWTCAGNGSPYDCTSPAPVSGNGGRKVATIAVVPNRAATNVVIEAGISPRGDDAQIDAATACSALTCVTNTQAGIDSNVDLSIAVSRPLPALTIGGFSDYTFTIKNNGSAPATNAQLRIGLPAEMSVAPNSASATGLGWTCNSGTAITCAYTGSIPNGGESKVNLRVITDVQQMGKDATVYGSVDVKGGNAAVDPNGCVVPKQCASDTTPVGEIVATVVLRPSWVQPLPALKVGVHSTYQLRIANAGVVNANAATAHVRFADGAVYDSFGGDGWSCVHDGSDAQLIKCTRTTRLDAQSDSVLSLTVHVKEHIARRDVVQYAWVDVEGRQDAEAPQAPCRDTHGCVATDPADVDHGIDLTFDIKGPTPELRIGTQSTYSVAIRNAGTAAATGAEVRMLVPAGMEFVSYASQNWSCTHEGLFLDCAYKEEAKARAEAQASSAANARTIGLSGDEVIEFTVIPQLAFASSTYTQYVAVRLPGALADHSIPGDKCFPDALCSKSSAAPVGSTNDTLLLLKSVGTRKVEIGDLVTYTLSVKNPGAGMATAVSIQDRLPAGFRLEKRTTKMLLSQGGAVTSPEPVVSSGGLKFEIGNIAGGATAEVTYSSRVGVGAKIGTAINRARAASSNGLSSSDASVSVEVTAGVFTDDGCIAGKVFVDMNGDGIQSGGEPAIARAKIYMQNGMHFTTDWAGRYSFCGVKSRSNVVKLDKRSIPPGCSLKILSNSNMGDAGSIFLGASNGHLQRGDFAVTQCSAGALEEIEKRNSSARSARSR